MIYKFHSHKAYLKTEMSALDSPYRFDLSGIVKNSEELGSTGKGIRIAVLDSGNVDHKSITIKSPAYNLGPTKNANDATGHAHISCGIIGADDEKNVVGIAPKSEIIPLKITDDHDVSKYNSVSAGILLSTALKCNIAVISPKIDISNSVINYSIEKASKSNVIVVASSDFQGSGAIFKKINNTSNVDAYSCFVKNKFSEIDPANFEAAYTAGIIALIMEKYGTNMSFDQINEKLNKLLL
jgi:hypothetical protein